MRAWEADRRITAADPVAERDLSSQLETAKRQLLDAIDPPVARRRGRRIVAVAVVAAVLVAVAALLPSRDHDTAGLPAPVAALADDLGGQGILHVVTASREVRSARIESWISLDSGRWRSRLTTEGGGSFGETVSDGRMLTIVNSEQGVLEQIPLHQFGPASQLTPVWLPRLRSSLLADTARVAGTVPVRGRPALEVAVDVVKGDRHATDTRVFVDRTTHAMLRIDRLNTLVGAWERDDVVTYEVLSDTPATRRLLLPTIETLGTN
jgi:hypothetical protein